MNIIDLEKKYYKRESDEFIFEIDFKNRLLNYRLKEDNISIEDAPISAEFNKEGCLINLRYNLGEEIKEIIIQLL